MLIDQTELFIMQSKKASTGTSSNTSLKIVESTQGIISSSVKVQIIVLPSGETETLNLPKNTTVEELKYKLSPAFDIGVERLRIICNSEEAENIQTLDDLGLGTKCDSLFVRSVNEIAFPLKTGVFKSFQNGTIRQVNIDKDSGKVVDVRIENQAYKKPFLGGWKNKITGAEFLNASSQTCLSVGNWNIHGQYESRDAQTYVLDDIAIQTRADMSTQVEWKFMGDTYISTSHDYVIAPTGHYITSEEKEARELESVIILQKYWRVWLAKRRAKELRKKVFDTQEQMKNIYNHLEDDKMKRKKERQKRQLHPQKLEDFEIVYSNLTTVIRNKINDLLLRKSGPELKAELCEVLEQECTHLFQISSYKEIALKEMKKRFIEFLLSKASAPLKWGGGKVSVHDPHTLLARLHYRLYCSLSRSDCNSEERQDVLFSLKSAVEHWYHPRSIEVVSLAEREIDLLSRGVKGNMLSGLRARILDLYISLIKDPKFNPGIKRVPSVLGNNLKDKIFCVGCGQSLSPIAYNAKASELCFPRCNSCQRLENESIYRVDFSYYRQLLKELRTKEGLKGSTDSIIFHMEFQDMRRLLDEIWKSQSAISQNDDLDVLTFTRWNKSLEWSPWNCILLTREETQFHEELNNPQDSYTDKFRYEVINKHVMAKLMFPHLLKLTQNKH